MFDGDPPIVNQPDPLESTILILRERSGALPWLRRRADWLAPPRCVACGQRGDLGSIDLCACCAATLPWQDAATAPFRYADPVGSGLRALKYAGDPRPARVFGALLAAHLLRHGAPQALVPVPLHPRRQLERGYNQAELIAREAGAWLRIPVLSRLLRRCRDTAAQAQLPAAARRPNVEGAFAAAPRAARLPGGVALRHVALVDDVCTTGATLHAAGRALRGLGLARIDLRSVALAQASENLTVRRDPSGPGAGRNATRVTTAAGSGLTITRSDALAGRGPRSHACWRALSSEFLTSRQGTARLENRKSLNNID